MGARIERDSQDVQPIATCAQKAQRPEDFRLRLVRLKWNRLVTSVPSEGVRTGTGNRLADVMETFGAVRAGLAQPRENARDIPRLLMNWFEGGATTAGYRAQESVKIS